MRHCVRIAVTFFAVPLFAMPVLAAGTPPAPSMKPAPVIYEVAGLKWNGYRYVDQPGYLLRTPNLKQASDYAAQFACFPGWTVRTNLPAPPPIANAAPTVDLPPYVLNWLYRLGIQPSQLQPSVGGADDSVVSSVDTPSYNDTSDIQNMIATQDMLNRQQEFNNMQDMINLQNFLNTQNMINNMQNDVNTQNMVNEQNMINAMNNP
jgi:hypothetical protein